VSLPIRKVHVHAYESIGAAQAWLKLSWNN